MSNFWINLKIWWRFSPYKKLYFWAGRPFTFILRDIWHRLEFIWIVGLISVGVWAGHHYDWETILKGLLIFTLGYIAGHLFWGKDYIENQQGK